MRPFALSLALALALAGPSAAAAADAALAAQTRRPPTVTVVAAVRGEIAETVAVTGSLAPREEVLVGVDVEGARLLELYADAGDRVAQGQRLARLDPAAFEIELAQNEAQRARADAAAAQAESLIAEMTASKAEADSALRRVETLKARGVAAADALDERTAAASVMAAKLIAAERGLDLARAERASLEAARREIALRLSRTDILAPRAGVVLSRTARIGMVASMQAEPLFRIAADGLVELDAEVTETDLARVRAGQRATVTAAGAPPVTGEVRLVSPSVDPLTRLGHVRVALPADPALREGVFARGLIEIARREGVLVPASALGAGAVQVVRDGRVETRKVETGLRDGGIVEIRAGLEAGETVVLKAGAFLGDGDAVTPALAEARP